MALAFIIGQLRTPRGGGSNQPTSFPPNEILSGLNLKRVQPKSPKKQGYSLERPSKLTESPPCSAPGGNARGTRLFLQKGEASPGRNSLPSPGTAVDPAALADREGERGVRRRADRPPGMTAARSVFEHAVADSTEREALGSSKRDSLQLAGPPRSRFQSSQPDSPRPGVEPYNPPPGARASPFPLLLARVAWHRPSRHRPN